jgi:hypothetical protein
VFTQHAQALGLISNTGKRKKKRKGIAHILLMQTELSFLELAHESYEASFKNNC